MSRRVLGASVALCACVTASAALDFEPMSLDRMIRAADLVVVGVIESVSKDRFSVHVTDPVAAPETSGEPGGSVTIRRNKDWSGDGGGGVYREGRRVLVFAAAAATDAGAEAPPWRVLGFEDEAVLPGDDGHVYYAGGALEGFEAATWELQGATVTAYRFELDDFVKAVKAHRACFGEAPDAGSAAPVPPRVLCPEAELEALRNDTTLGPYLIRQANQG